MVSGNLQNIQSNEENGNKEETRRPGARKPSQQTAYNSASTSYQQ